MTGFDVDPEMERQRDEDDRYPFSPCDLIPDDAILWITLGGDAPHPTTWEEFQGNNSHGEDGDALAFLEDVATALHARREYRGGGGAAPTYVVRWYPVPA